MPGKGEVGAGRGLGGIGMAVRGVAARGGVLVGPCPGDRFLALGEGQGSHYSSLPKVLAGVSPWEEQFARAVPLKSQCGVIITPVLSPFKLETTVLLGFCHRLSINFAKCF